MSRTDGKQSVYSHENTLLGSLTSLKLTPKTRNPWSRPLVSQTPSSTTIARTHGRKEKGDRNEKGSYEKSGLDSILSEISEFNDGLNASFVPEYTDFEHKTNLALDNFQTQIEKLQALHDQAKKLFEQFQQQDATARDQLEEEIKVLQRWQTPQSKIQSMNDKVSKLRAILTSGKERLGRIDEELSAAEEEGRRVQSQVFALNSTLILLTFAVALLAYYLLR